MLLFSACGIFKGNTQAKKSSLDKQKKIVLESVEKNQIRFQQLTIKYSATYKDSKRSYNLKGTIKMLPDSVFYLTASPGLGIEALRLMVTPDQVHILNRLQGEYLHGQLSFFKQKTGFDLNLSSLQAILISNYTTVLGASSNDLTEHVFKTDSANYVFDLFEQSYYESLMFSNNAFLQQYQISQRNNNQIINQLYLKYDDYFMEATNNIAHKINVYTIGKEQITLNLQYKKVDFEQPVNIRFTVPDKYIKKDIGQ